ncbi:hypothetical protein NDU88_007585 [Pleurodeles waltl]|uniref:Uncharacterized protein n=1 Tax=Pleurodeles waltl TaxID=8319 RepID=A0AAV7NV97_PLEWA|nr:hypothetical protein NDU88_007585 [Pleurodeles waltl]
MEGLRRKMVLTDVLNTRKLQGLLPLEILMQPSQSQAQACADSAHAALEAKPGRCPSVSAKRTDCLGPAGRERRLKGGPRHRAPIRRGYQVSKKTKIKNRKKRSEAKLVPETGEPAVQRAEGEDRVLSFSAGRHAPRTDATPPV